MSDPKTTLYLPTLIRDTAHAASFPVGTVAVSPATESDGQTALVLCDDGVEGLGWQDEHEIKEDEYVVGWTALVPVEATVEEQEAGGVSILHGDTHYWPAQRRYVTPWTPTEASA